MGFYCERELVTEQNWNILTPLLWPSTLCLSRSPDAQPEALGSTLLGAGFLYCILSASSLVPNSSGPQAPSAWCGFPYHNSSITPTPTVIGTLSWLSYIIVQCPLDRLLDLLEWHDWSASSGNNCHAVHRLLSSGASVDDCIMGFTLSHFISQIHPRDLFRLLAIGMCHFLPVYHFVMACLLWPKVKIQQRRIIGFIPFPRVLVLCEMQSVSSRIWTRIAVSISFDVTILVLYTEVAPEPIEYE